MRISTISSDEENAIRNFLKGRHIPVGLGDRGEACSIASINLALSGRLTSDIPECMSPVIGRWIITIQDAMPNVMRNSDQWRELLPLAAGTGRDFEGERLAIIRDWIWGTVLPHLQELADEQGFGSKWEAMTTKRTAAHARAAAEAANGAADAAWVDAADAVAAGAAHAAYAADAAARAAVYADAVDARTRAAWAAAVAAAAARAVAAWAYADARAAAWKVFDPASLLSKLIKEGQ